MALYFSNKILSFLYNIENFAYNMFAARKRSRVNIREMFTGGTKLCPTRITKTIRATISKTRTTRAISRTRATRTSADKSEKAGVTPGYIF